MSKNDEIKVSVCVVTYNQEKYIGECLQSLVDQETDFPFEIIVGEDCSTDRTREIVDHFALKYPDLIVKNYHDENVGAVQNVISTYRMARGDYICHMDGDDGAFAEKLKKVVDVLDNNPKCIMVTHDMVVFDKKSKVVRDSLKKFKEGFYSTEDLVLNLPFFTNSAKTVRRYACIESLENLHENAIDVELHVLESRYGEIFHINSPLGFYREMVGVSSIGYRVNPLIVDGYVRVFEGLIANNDIEIDIEPRSLKKAYAKSMLNFSYQSIFFGDNKKARNYCLKSINIYLFSLKQILVFGLTFTGVFSKYFVKLRSVLVRNIIKKLA